MDDHSTSTNPAHGLETKVQRPSTGERTQSVTMTKARQRRLALKNHFIASIGEFLGTMLFLLFALSGTNVANVPATSVAGADGNVTTPNTSNLLYISLSFAFSLAVNAWVFYRVSGGLFNPAVSLGLALAGVIPPVRAIFLVIAQILGGIVGSAIVYGIYPPGALVNVQTKLSSGTTVTQGLFIEMFMTFELMITIFMLAAEKHKATFLAPIGIGLALFIAEMSSVYYTGGSLNPARSFGPDVVLGNFNGYHWIYWVGPALGALMATAVYKTLKFLNYTTVVPDQDAAGELPNTGANNMRITQPGLSLD